MNRLTPVVRDLNRLQGELFLLFAAAIVRDTAADLHRLLDEDVASASGAVASTLETAGRGVIYEHQAQSVVAQRLARELQAAIAELREKGATIYDGEAAITLRAIERGARDAKADGTAPTAYLDLMARLLQANRAARVAATGEAPEGRAPSPIILP